mmetsp:Transcript_49152/g.96075  ORF Transcript_49152/g.96075 Transcript_49152/m.96075 type:complete len:483 (-) Transcript_49152:216-1664(-)|eukprot:CAMPEP_0194312042 /NCGR_PEP_ID=MMETSP0171-20130528/8964_1 /TAXON_ID=218684 /ORGANISM="Corethron pennatum, Strain L29A3" /LENGTH=482 /DNA_ID=CAMNT_0039066397 /DNA_START=282 /DNA_END=1730 /DNA_ORIENTATION=+
MIHRNNSQSNSDSGESSDSGNRPNIGRFPSHDRPSGTDTPRNVLYQSASSSRPRRRRAAPFFFPLLLCFLIFDAYASDLDGNDEDSPRRRLASRAKKRGVNNKWMSDTSMAVGTAVAGAVVATAALGDGSGEDIYMNSPYTRDGGDLYTPGPYTDGPPDSLRPPDRAGHSGGAQTYDYQKRLSPSKGFDGAAGLRGAPQDNRQKLPDQRWNPNFREQLRPISPQNGVHEFMSPGPERGPPHPPPDANGGAGGNDSRIVYQKHTRSAQNYGMPLVRETGQEHGPQTRYPPDGNGGNDGDGNRIMYEKHINHQNYAPYYAATDPRLYSPETQEHKSVQAVRIPVRPIHPDDNQDYHGGNVVHNKRKGQPEPQWGIPEVAGGRKVEMPQRVKGSGKKYIYPEEFDSLRPVQDQMVVISTVATMALLVGALSARRMRSRQFLSSCIENESLEDELAYDTAYTTGASTGYGAFTSAPWRGDLEKFDV